MKNQMVRVLGLIAMALLLTGNFLYAQQGVPDRTTVPADSTVVEKSISEGKTFKKPDIMPSFRGGGLEKFRVWVGNRVKWPKEYLKGGILDRYMHEGEVVVKFIIEKDGSVSNVKVLSSQSGVDGLLAREVVRVIEKSPRWKPGMHEGKPIRMPFYFPVKFRARK